jgi:hypothetical protein
MNRSEFVALSAAALAATGQSASAASAIPAAVAGVAMPDTVAARAALALATSSEDPQVLRHSLRSYYFGSLIGAKLGVAFDPQTLFVACTLHDLGLSPDHATPHARFEIDGANAARAALVAGGASAEDARRAWDAVTLHAIYSIAKFKEPEVRLASAGIITDVGAAFAKLLDPGAVRDILATFSRKGFNESFVAVLTDYTKRKPDTVGGSFFEDIAVKTIHGYQVGSFADEMAAGDAFAALGFAI